MLSSNKYLITSSLIFLGKIYWSTLLIKFVYLSSYGEIVPSFSIFLCILSILSFFNDFFTKKLLILFIIFLGSLPRESINWILFTSKTILFFIGFTGT